MSIVTISRGSYSWGKEVAEKVARRLGYECLARDILIEASKEFNLPEIKLAQAIQDAPSFFDRFTHRKKQYVAYIQAAILRRLCKDNVVYHGLAGHFFVKGIPHVLKVRIIADLEDRVKLVMERDGISKRQALRFLKKIDDQRVKWSQQLYGIDTRDPSLYDLVLHIHKITVDDAVGILLHTLALPHFQTTPESQRAMEDLALAAEVKSSLIQVKPDIQVSANNGLVHITTQVEVSVVEEEVLQQLESAARRVPGVKEVKIEVLRSAPYSD